MTQMLERAKPAKRCRNLPAAKKIKWKTAVCSFFKKKLLAFCVKNLRIKRTAFIGTIK